jgi:hypothetical protein
MPMHCSHSLGAPIGALFGHNHVPHVGQVLAEYEGNKMFSNYYYTKVSLMNYA